MQKYFLALVPEGEIAEKALQIKEKIRDQFNIKYALKSPSHITLKMPFSYNEAKEDYLRKNLEDFAKEWTSFLVRISGVGNFGERVVFLRIEQNESLQQFQSELKMFCKRELKLVDELSDRNYHPHLTVAFKDMKSNRFPEVLQLVKEHAFESEFLVHHFYILKRNNGYWKVFEKISFGKNL